MPFSEERNPTVDWVLDEDRLNTVLDTVEKDLNAYHKVLSHTRCQSVALEEMFCHGFRKAKIKHDWTPQSHRKGFDIDVLRWSVSRAKGSVKSGSRTTINGRPGALKFSGGRHGSHGGDLAAMHRSLLAHAPDFYLMGADPLGSKPKFAHLFVYSIHAFDGRLVNYGQASDWARAANGKDFEFSGNGIYAKISRATTNQVWTTIDNAALGLQPVRQIIIRNKETEAAGKRLRGNKKPATDEEIAQRMKWGTLALENDAPADEQMTLPLILPEGYRPAA